MVLPIKPVFFWLIILIVMLVIEAATLGLTTIWFAVGSLVALLLSLTKAGLLAQIIVCIIVSVVLLILVRPWALKRFNYGRTRTNAQSLIGQGCIVIEEINNLESRGRARISGQEWSARSTDEERTIPVGAKVVVREISGVKLIVEPAADTTGPTEENAEQPVETAEQPVETAEQTAQDGEKPQE